ncbi:MAG: tetratricopeptide repeat protein [Verrucomicrobia bacterium]|nr:MAG: tetratricopeptide repeat protein [Verrucomicrobiota bacterium]
MYFSTEIRNYFFGICNKKCFFIRFLALLFLPFCLLSSLRSENSGDPAQEFLIAYQNFQQAERLERAGKQSEAITKYQYSEGILKALSTNNPDWQQPVVDYRLHKVRDSLARLNATVHQTTSDHDESFEKTPFQEGPANNYKPSGKSISDTKEEQNLKEGPSISITPPSTKKNLPNPQIAQLQQQLQKSELELKKVLQNLHDKTIELDHSKVVIIDMKSQLEKTERQVSDLKTDLSKANLRGMQREEALQQSVRTLESKLDALTAEQEIVLEENKQLQDHLNQAEASLTAAMGARQHLEDLQLEVNKEKNNAALLHQKLLISQSEYKATSELNSTLKKQLLEANASLTQSEKQAKEASALRIQLDNLRADDASLQAQISAMNKDQQENSNHLKEVAQTAQCEYQVLETKKIEIEKKLSEANEKIKKLENNLLHQDAMEEEIAHYKKELQESSLKLIDQEKKITELEKAKPENDQILNAKEKELAFERLNSEKLLKDLATATQKISVLQEEVHLKDDHYSELKKQLDSKSEELLAIQKKEDPYQIDENAIVENQLLKGIVIRALKAEAKRQQIKKLITDDLQKLKVNSVTLSNELKRLAKPMKLTPDEKALFKDVPTLPTSSVTEEEENDDFLMLAAVATKKEDHSNLKEESAHSQNSPSATSNITQEDKSADHSSNNVGPVNGKNNAETSQKHRELIAAAKEEFEHHNYFEAEKKFQDAITISPDDYLTLSNLGVVQFQLGKMAEAESVLKKAVALDHKKSFALTTLGIVEYRQEKMSEAEKDLREAIAINDQDFTAHNYLGIVLAASGKGKAGESEIMKALEINPQYADAHFNLAVIYATSMPPAKEIAKSHYQKAIGLGAPTDVSLEKILN